MNSPGPKSRVARWLEHPRAGWIAIAFALALFLPSLSLGFFADDYALIDFLEHRFPRNVPWWDLYRFTPSDPADFPRFIAAGEYPWWTTPDLRLHFARPLASAWLAFDHAVFGRAAVLWHVESLIAYGALLVTMRALFRRLLPPATATLALVLFAFTDALISPVAWLSARHGLLSALLSALGLLALVRWRTEGWKPGRVLALLSFFVSLFCDEAALGGLALAVAYELLGTIERPLASRARGALPFATLGVAFLGVYGAAGYGASGSAGYLSPLSEPGHFLMAAATRLPDLLADALLGIPVEVVNLGLQRQLATVGLLATILTALLLRAVLPRATSDERAALRWLLPGALLALVGALGGFPGGRELLVPDFGLSTMLAVLIVRGLGSAPGARAAFVCRAGAGFLALVHVVFAPLWQLGNQQSLKAMGAATQVVANDLARVRDSSERIRFIEASDPMVSMYAVTILAAETPPSDACAAWIGGVHADMVVERTGPRAFTLAPKGTTFLKGAFESLTRAPWKPMVVGAEQPICGAVVRVIALDSGLPSRIEVTADADLDDPNGGWAAWQKGALRRFVFPPIGETSVIEWTPGPMGIF